MRATLWIGGIAIFGVIIIIIAPPFIIQNSGSATLVQIRGSSILGTANLSPSQGGQVTVINVQVQQLAPMTTYALSIRAGSCYGKTLTALQPATTDYNGNGSSSTTLGATIQSFWFIVLHNGSSTRNPILACGQVVINSIFPNNNTPQPPIVIPTIPGQFPNTGGGPPQP